MWDKINDLLANPGGPFALLCVCWIGEYFFEQSTWARVWPRRRYCALAFGYAALVAARHFEFTLTEQYGIILGVFFGITEALPPPPRDRQS